MSNKITWPYGPSLSIEEGIKNAQDYVGAGWSELIDQLIKDLIELGWNGRINQVKEKFGGLRFYIGGGSDEIFERIHKAEAESYKICEHCGAPGSTRGSRGYIRCLCKTCRAEANKARSV